MAEIIRVEVHAYRTRPPQGRGPQEEFESEFAAWYEERVLRETAKLGEPADPKWFECRLAEIRDQIHRL